MNTQTQGTHVAGQNQAAAVIVNKLSEPITAQVHQKLVEMKEVSFAFRTDKETKKKRATLKVNAPLLTAAGLIVALQAGDKSTALALDQANEAIINQMRGQINAAIEANPDIELKPEVFDMDKLGFAFIANLPKGERGAGIPKEDFAAMVEDYKAVMVTPEAVALFADTKPRSPEILAKHGVLLQGKFNQVRSRKDVVEQMLQFLDVWAQVSPNVEEHQTVYDFLREKGNTILSGESFDDL